MYVISNFSRNRLPFDLTYHFFKQASPRSVICTYHPIYICCHEGRRGVWITKLFKSTNKPSSPCLFVSSQISIPMLLRMYRKKLHGFNPAGLFLNFEYLDIYIWGRRGGGGFHSRTKANEHISLQKGGFFLGFRQNLLFHSSRQEQAQSVFREDSLSTRVQGGGGIIGALLFFSVWPRFLRDFVFNNR